MGYRSQIMTMESKKELFSRYKQEYFRVGRQRQSEILTILCDATGVHRKAAIRKLHALENRVNTPHKGRKVVYGPDVDAALREVWETAGELCAELLYPEIQEYVSIFKRDRMWSHPRDTTAKLLAMSLGTVKNRIRNFQGDRESSRGATGTSPSHLKHIIPIFNGPWHDLPPGHGQIDTVVHCGVSLAGDMSHTVNYIDAATYWVVPRAQWNKGQGATLASIQAIRERLPFALLGLHPDSGSEFVNWVAKDWCDAHGIPLPGSRPGNNNDNMFVEERNGHVVRRYLGYARLDVPETVARMNLLYDVLGLYLNHFIPVRRTLTKERVGARYRRVYEKTPCTPYQRVLARDDVSDEIKSRLRHEHGSLNPKRLKAEIEQLLDAVYDTQKHYRNPRSREAFR